MAVVGSIWWSDQRTLAVIHQLLALPWLAGLQAHTLIHTCGRAAVLVSSDSGIVSQGLT